MRIRCEHGLADNQLCALFCQQLFSQLHSSTEVCPSQMPVPTLESFPLRGKALRSLQLHHIVRYYHILKLTQSLVIDRCQVSASKAEYGELKSAFVYPISIDNKARYCLLNNCTLVVGGSLPEAAGRSSRWLKVAWLQRAFDDHEWLVWMDLDAIFVRTSSLEVLPQLQQRKWRIFQNLLFP